MWKLFAITFLLVGCSGESARVESAPPVIQFAPLKRASWSAQEHANVELVSSFVQLIMNDHDFDAVYESFNNDAYVQHNRNLPDGIEGLVGFLKEFVADYPEYSYDVKHIYSDGDYVVFHSHATLKKEDRGNQDKGMNIVDTWRVKDGRIVEHWDAIQPLDRLMRVYVLFNGGNIRNDNGVF
ncbi:MAG: nuclear transport factor 2 family protein [Pseudomonadota bacterium]